MSSARSVQKFGEKKKKTKKNSASILKISIKISKDLGMSEKA